MGDIELKDFKGANYKCVKRLYRKNKTRDGYIIFPLFAIYEKPKDFPEKYVIRLWYVNRDAGKSYPTSYYVTKDTLEECRQALPNGLYKFGRDSSDDPVIVETWI